MVDNLHFKTRLCTEMTEPLAGLQPSSVRLNCEGLMSHWRTSSRVTPVCSPAWQRDASITVLWVTTELPDGCVLMHNDNKTLSQITAVPARCLGPTLPTAADVSDLLFDYLSCWVENSLRKMLIEMWKFGLMCKAPSVPCACTGVPQNRTGNSKWRQFA